jgi:predicted dehydrogenase
MKIGTIGTGNILNSILDAVKDTDDIVCEAVYSRNESTGKALADKFRVRKVYTELEDMLADDKVDFIYIASPNSLHYEHARQALEHGKNVICEKPFTSTLKEASELAEIAKQRELFLFEAITTTYLPNYQIIREQVKNLGNIKLVLCNYSQYSSRYDKLLAGEITNAFSPEFSGGTLMDINLYNIYFVMGLFGKPDYFRYYSNRISNGIDTSGILIMKYPEFVCECTGAKDAWGVNSVQIQGEKGFMYVTDGSNGCSEVRVTTREYEKFFNEQKGHHQWYFEIQGITRLVGERNYDECWRRLDKTLEVMEVIEKARKEEGILFDADK